MTGNVISIRDKHDEAKRWPTDVFGWKERTRLRGDVALSDMEDETGSIAEIDWDMSIVWNRPFAEAARSYAADFGAHSVKDYFDHRPIPLQLYCMIERLPRTQLRAIEHLEETVSHILRSVSDASKNPWRMYDPETGIWVQEGEWLPGQRGKSVNTAVSGLIRNFTDALNRQIDLLRATIDWVVPSLEKPDPDTALEDELRLYRENEEHRDALFNGIREAHEFARAIPRGLYTKIEADLRRRLAINQSEWDADSRYLILRDGVVDLMETYRTGEVSLQSFSPQHWSTMALDMAWDSPVRNAGQSEWERGVNKILPDPEVREYLQKRYGAALLGTPGIAGKSMVWQYGPGDTAKSTIQECIAGERGVFMPYSLPTSSQALLASRGGGKNDQGERFIAYARGKRFAIMDEIQDGEMLDAEIVKRVTGGGSVEGKALYSNSIRYFFTATIFISSNHPPTFPPGDTALQNRIHVVPFKHRFWVQSKNPEEWAAAKEEDRADESWANRVLDSAQERSAILRWVIEGLVKFGREGGIGDLPEAMKDEHDDFVADADPVATLVNALLGEEPGTEGTAWLEIVPEARWIEMGLKESDGVRKGRLEQLIKTKAEHLGMVDKNGQVTKKTVQRTRSMLSERGGNWKRIKVPNTETGSGSGSTDYAMARMLEVNHPAVAQFSNKWDF